MSTKPKLRDDLKNTYVVIGFNSNSLLESMMMGYPVFVLDPGSLVYDLARHSLAKINKSNLPPADQKQQLFYDIAYTQWNTKEIKSGQALKHILQGYEESLKHRDRAYNMEKFCT